ncbi:Calx-beta domain-containing protein [Lysobacter sp. cf310]|uniref:Calx-beta domain-containing protein n=1 Tax=Lysobacter sp. cf310 TaxID=1761790 RepID=UPI0008EE947F|nr:Calx-beta domain-containing protein [Lysobacter sp. cf310]SFK49937.1 conserved repeat domain-containing protein [Lysobacter sp. cf310]
MLDHATRRLGALGLAVAAAVFAPDASAQVQRTFVNLGFEQPVLTGSNCFLILPVGLVPGWATDHPSNLATGSCSLAGVTNGASINGPVEIWRGPAFSSVPPRAGDQHAELNAYTPSRLSQTICLTNGERVDWRLSHRGRNSNVTPDVMNFNIDSTANTVAVLSSTTVAGGIPVCVDSGSVDNISCTVAAGGNGWADYSGSFNWNGTSGNHNFGFQAVGGGAAGNFLDDIQVTLRPYLEFDPVSYTTREAQAVPSLPTIRITGTVPAGGITVLVNITGGTATTGGDYLINGGNVNVTIPAGTYDDNRFPIPITIIDDGVIENNETVLVQVLPNAAAYTLASTTSCGSATVQNTATLTILDNDVDLRTTKTNSGNATPPAGGTTQFTVAYTNNTAKPTVGDTTAHDAIATITDAVPAGLTFTSWTCAGSNGGVCSAASGSGAISGSATLPAGTGGVAGGTVTYTINATLGTAQCAVLTNNASIATNAPLGEGVAAQVGFTTPVPGGSANNSASATVDPMCADLTITKTQPGNVTTYTPGDIATYTIQACNPTGPDGANGATINDALPSGVSLTGPWACVGSGGGSCPATGGTLGDTAVAIAGVNLPVNACVDVTVNVRFSPNANAY